MEFPNNKGRGGGYAMQPYAAMGMGPMGGTGPQFGVTPEMLQGYSAEMMQVRCRAGQGGP